MSRATLPTGRSARYGPRVCAPASPRHQRAGRWCSVVRRGGRSLGARSQPCPAQSDSRAPSASIRHRDDGGVGSARIAPSPPRTTHRADDLRYRSIAQTSSRRRTRSEGQEHEIVHFLANITRAPPRGREVRRNKLEPRIAPTWRRPLSGSRRCITSIRPRERSASHPGAGSIADGRGEASSAGLGPSGRRRSRGQTL